MAKKKSPARQDVANTADADLWSIIERVDRSSKGELEAACDAFRAELEALDDNSLVKVVEQFNAAMTRAYNWDLWGAAYVIHGGTSDDHFWDFRAGLVAMGREAFERSLEDPDSMSEIDGVEERTLFEGFQYVPDNVLEARGLDARGSHGHDRKPSGTKWNEDDLAKRFPKLSSRFS